MDSITKSVKKVIKINYTIFNKNKKKNDVLKKISHTNSNTAKNGYKEEFLVCNDLNKNSDLRKSFVEFLGNNYDHCSRVNGNYKCDIQSNNKVINGQVKKYKKGQFQQLDRHWIDYLIKYIPELEEVSYILKNLCECPLLSNKTHIDKSKSIKKLCLSNYSQIELNNFIDILNKHKKEILNYAFFGTNQKLKPEYLFGIEYKDNIRRKIILYKIKDIIIYLEKLQFRISKRKTVIKLGNDSILSLQRKGGDGGKKSSNQLQTKIIVSKLLNKVHNLEYFL
jgi:hypothetical protein